MFQYTQTPVKNGKGILFLSKENPQKNFFVISLQIAEQRLTYIFR